MSIAGGVRGKGIKRVTIFTLRYILTYFCASKYSNGNLNVLTAFKTVDNVFRKWICKETRGMYKLNTFKHAES